MLIFIEFDKFAWHVFIFGLFDGIVQYVIVSVYVRRYACRGRALKEGRPKMCQNIMACHNLTYQLVNRFIGNITANNN